MRSSLSPYWKKRDFSATPEPKGGVARAGKALSFVIQKHAARRLHYDFRLELDGTLKSWAVPKGPSLDPHVRRMAVHVEDHPLSYATFEGVIPAGQYGAGTVIVWDRGEWTPLGDPREGYRTGKLKFELHGEKLHGRWMLVRMHGRQGERQEPWLLIKENDEEVRPAADYDITEALPGSVNAKPAPKAGAKPAAKKKAASRKASARKPAAMKASSRARKKPKAARDLPMPARAEQSALPLTLFPQLATLVDEPPEGAGWVYELKFDGYRIVARIEGDDVRLFTRNGNDWSARLKGLREEIRSLGIGEAWLDGEIVVLDDKGLPDFQMLQQAFDTTSRAGIVYYVFDLPYYGGYDLRRVPLAQRREMLRQVMQAHPSDRVRFSQSYEGSAAELLEGACASGLEGLVGKRADAAYSSTRSTSWIKLKCTKRQEFVICGYTDPKGSRAGFGSLLLGVNDREGRLRYAGSVGTGFGDEQLRTLKAKLAALETAKPPLHETPRGVKGHWVKPRLVCEVAFTEWTSDGRVRHPTFRGLRGDKDPEAIVREEPMHAPSAPRTPAAKPRSRSARRPSGEVMGISVTHPDRVVDAKTGVTKLELVRYYEAIAPHMIPHLEGRPIALVRAPYGIGGELFFQKHGEKIAIPGIIQLPREYWPGHPAMLEIASAETLVGAAQMNVIEFHTWNSTTKLIDKPDRFLLDMDPGEGIEWSELVEGTALVKKMLDLLGLESFLKTSGGKGLHVVVPLAPSQAWGYDEVKDFSQAIVRHLARTLPQLFVAKSGARNRVGRIFVDYLRNGTGATTVAAFSARARPGLGVSVPVKWSELKGLERADQWNVRNVHERLARLRTDPWKGYERVRQTPDEAWARLRAETEIRSPRPARTRSARPSAR
jgi:bifunctional non-homologous end joining protein LigD